MEKNKSDKKVNKSKIFTALSVLLTLILSIVCGLYLTNGALYEGQKKYKTRNFYAPVSSIIPLTLKDGMSIEQLDSELSASDTNYIGAISADSIFNSTYKNKSDEEKSTKTLLYSKYLKKDEILFRNSKITLLDGFYPAYYTGWEWSAENLGETYTITLNLKNGGIYDINVMVVGHCIPEKLGDFLVGKPYISAYRSFLIIDEFDIVDIYDNAYKNTVVFSVSKPFPIENYGRYNNSLFSKNILFIEAFMQSLLNSPLYKTYLYFIFVIIIILIIAFTGGQYRMYHYMVYGILNSTVMLVAYYVKIKNISGFYVYENTFNQWFARLLLITLGIALVSSIISIIPALNNTKNKGKFKNDSAPKYL